MTTSEHESIDHQQRHQRRDFSRFLLGQLGMLPQQILAWPSQLAQTPRGRMNALGQPSASSSYGPGPSVMNRLSCPSPARPRRMYRSTKTLCDPSFDNRQKMSAGKEEARRLLAQFVRVTPEEIVIARNTSEANNIVSSGLDLKAGDEVVIFADNHPSNNNAWTQKAKRFGYTVTVINQPNPHPGADYFVEAAKRSITPRTRVLAFTHQTSTVGDVLPAKELCRLARERDVLTLVDGASARKSSGVSRRLQPDFYNRSYTSGRAVREVGASS